MSNAIGWLHFEAILASAEAVLATATIIVDTIDAARFRRRAFKRELDRQVAAARRANGLDHD